MGRGIRYRQFDHTGDLGLEIEGEDPSDLFSNAGLALSDILYDLEKVRPRQEVGMTLRGADRTELLVRFLAEILYLFDVEEFQFCGFSFPLVREDRLRVVGRGEPFQRGRHRVRTAIKAVTYHQALVEPVEGGALRARVILDV